MDNKKLIEKLISLIDTKKLIEILSEDTESDLDLVKEIFDSLSDEQFDEISKTILKSKNAKALFNFAKYIKRAPIYQISYEYCKCKDADIIKFINEIPNAPITQLENAYIRITEMKREQEQFYKNHTPKKCIEDYEEILYPLVEIKLLLKQGLTQIMKLWRDNFNKELFIKSLIAHPDDNDCIAALDIYITILLQTNPNLDKVGYLDDKYQKYLKQKEKTESKKEF
jgi:hypothetical protein